MLLFFDVYWNSYLIRFFEDLRRFDLTHIIHRPNCSNGSQLLKTWVN